MYLEERVDDILWLIFICRSEKAMQSETCKGKVKEFCRSKGHGFIVGDNDHELQFVHISEYVDRGYLLFSVKDQILFP